MKIFIDSPEPLGSGGSFRMAVDRLNKHLKKIGAFSSREECEHHIACSSMPFGMYHEKAKNHWLVAWELPDLPDFLYLHAEAHRNEISVIGISKQATESYAKAGVKNLSHILLGCDQEEWYPEFVDQDKFTFLTDNCSNSRSGFEILIPAFGKAFQNSKTVRLHIKDRPGGAMKPFIDSVAEEFNIEIIYDTNFYAQPDLLRLYNKCNAFLYVNNSTSFGMTPLQAAFCAKPVLATGASAIIEFMNPEYSYLVNTRDIPFDDAFLNTIVPLGIGNFIPTGWFRYLPNQPPMPQPIESDVIDKLQYIYKNYAEADGKAKAGLSYYRENFSWDKSIEKLMQIVRNEQEQ